MPRKTKKEKKLAVERKQREVFTNANTNYKVTIPTEVVIHDKTHTLVSTKTNRDEKEDMQLRNYFTLDLKKSLLIVSSIIALEICLYFASINHYLPK